MEFLSFLEKDANKQLEESLAIMTKINSEMGKIGEKRKGISTPSGSDSANKQLIADYQKMEATIVKMQLAIDKLSVSKQNHNKKTQEEITNGRILAQNSDRQVKATSQLAGAYRNLSAQVAIASERYQNLIVRGRQVGQTQAQFNKELRASQQEFQKLQSKVLQADNAVGKWNRTNQRTIGLGRDLVSAFGIATGVGLFAQITKDVFETTKQIQSLDNALKIVTDTEANFYKQQAFLIDIAKRYGVELNGLTQQYTQFYVSAKDKLAGAEIQQIFESITKAGATMGLSVQNQERAFYAINQMMSKGTVQAEELRGQLGDALPKAFGIMVDAYRSLHPEQKVTEASFAKLMKDGKVLSAEILPAFAKQLEKAYGIEAIRNVDTLIAKQNKFKNSWTDLVRSLNESDTGGISKFFGYIINAFDIILQKITRLNTSWAQLYDNARKAGSEMGSSFFNEWAKDKTADEIINGLKDKTKEINSELRKFYAESIKLQKELKNTNPYALQNPLGQSPKDKKERLEALRQQIGQLEGFLKASEEYQKTTKKTTVVIDENTDKTKKATKAKRDDVESVIAQGLKSQEYLQVLEEQLRLYKEVQSEVSSTSDEYKAFQNVIDGLQQSIDLIKDPSKVLTADVSGLERQNEMYLKNREALLKLQEATDKWLETFRTDFFQQMGLGSLDQFFDGTFDKLIAGADSVEEKFRVSFLAISEVAQEAFNLINQAGQASTQAEIDRLKIQYDTAWEFSDKSDVAKRKLDAERERREKEIAQKEFKRKQNMAVVNIGIDTAQAIMATYGQAGWIGGTAGAIFLGAMGLAQIALVKSQKMPEYKDGTPFGGHGGGLMKINDAKGSNYQEIVKTPDGKMGMFKGRNVVVDAPKGTEVFTADESIRMMMFDPYLNNMISSTSTPVFKTEIQTQNIDFSPVVDAINNQPIIIPDFDKLKTRIKRGNTIQTIEKAHTNFSSVKI